MSEKKTNKLAATFKSQDTEEWLDIHFTRPLGLLWANFFNLFGTHPNVVTILSILLGLGAGICFYFTDFWTNLLGVGLLVWANLYDSCDGQLARMTGKKTRWGRILDGFAGDVWFFAIYVAISLRLMPTWGPWIWVLTVVTGFIFHGKQCALADYYRNIHLYFLKGKDGSELDRSDRLTAEFQHLTWRRDGAWKLFLFFYRNYTRSQERLTPAFQRLRNALAERFPKALPQPLRDDFRAGSLPLMKWANILTFNTRAIVLYIAVLVNEPWIYPVFEATVMNALMLYMWRRHENLCRRVQANLDTYETVV